MSIDSLIREPSRAPIYICTIPSTSRIRGSKMTIRRFLEAACTT
jgi:hypothetical protein